jgi:signal transduction histidine kinase
VGGSVHLQIVRSERDPHADPHHLREIGVRVRDSGIGIAAELHDAIFEPLYRVDKARTERRIGLGLTIAKTIITAHGGRITVQSAPDAGSTFTVWLPVG